MSNWKFHNKIAIMKLNERLLHQHSASIISMTLARIARASSSWVKSKETRHKHTHKHETKTRRRSWKILASHSRSIVIMRYICVIYRGQMPLYTNCHKIYGPHRIYWSLGRVRAAAKSSLCETIDQDRSTIQMATIKSFSPFEMMQSSKRRHDTDMTDTAQGIFLPFRHSRSLIFRLSIRGARFLQANFSATTSKKENEEEKKTPENLFQTK